MFEGFTVILLTTIVLVLVGIAVIVGLAIARRPADQWQEHLQAQTRQWEKLEDEGVDLDDVHPQDVTLETMISTTGSEGSAYLDAGAIPGFDRLEDAAGKLEDIPVPRSVKRVLGQPGTDAPAGGSRGPGASGSDTDEGAPHTRDPAGGEDPGRSPHA